MPTLGQVFVPGGLPEVTYVARETLRLERHVGDFLDERYRILSLSGPTKCGKTVLIRRAIPGAVLLSGGDITKPQDLWVGLVDQLGVYPEVTKQVAKEESETDTWGVSGEGGVPGIVKAGGELEAQSGTSTARTHTVGRSRPPNLLAQEALRRDLDVVVVIDDFHYIPPDAQLVIVRGLKSLVFDGLRVILASVPHRAFDAVRVETEMTGRVEHLTIPVWEDTELLSIATRGFKALNVASSEQDIRRLADETFGSPHLMQDFCLNLCKANDVMETTETRTSLRAPDWPRFFAGRATNASKAAFDLLAKGPPRTDRIPRTLKNGETTDIYGAVLAAIADTGPATTLPYDRLKTSLRNVLAAEPPQRHEVTRVLVAMSKIARERIEGEPVVDYDEAYGVLHISDPFFAFYLKWGAGENPKPVNGDQASAI